MLQTQSRSTQSTLIRFPVDSLVSAFLRKFPRDDEIGPALSRDMLEDFGRPKQQEDMLELRQQALSDWLSQLPKDDSAVEETNWTPSSQTLTNIAICTNKRTNEDRSQILDSEEFEDSNEDSLELKSQPSENHSPMEFKHDSRQVQSVRNHTELDSHGCAFDTEFGQQINFKTRCKSLELDPQRLSPRPAQTNNSEDSFWSVISHSNDISSPRNVEYNNHLTNHINQHLSEDLFHVKYKASSLRFQALTDRSACAQSVFPMLHSKAPKGDWWVPNVCFAASEEAMDDSSPHLVLQREDSVLPELPERIQQRLLQGARPNRRLPTRRRLIKRMKEAQKRHESKKSDLSCVLECPFDLRRMLDLPSKASEVNFSIAPEPQVMEYSAPRSLDGLSDFECYGGPLFSSLMFQQEMTYHSCQNWILDNVLCFFTGLGRSGSGNPPL